MPEGVAGGVAVGGRNGAAVSDGRGTAAPCAVDGGGTTAALARGACGIAVAEADGVGVSVGVTTGSPVGMARGALSTTSADGAADGSLEAPGSAATAPLAGGFWRKTAYPTAVRRVKLAIAPPTTHRHGVLRFSSTSTVSLAKAGAGRTLAAERGPLPIIETRG